MSNAEQIYRDAFNRLKKNKPIRLPKGTPVSQNNVAKEADRDPSALKKTRFPLLIYEIQEWVKRFGHKKPQSPRQSALASRKRNRDLRSRIEKLKAERDKALSLLVQADDKILELTMENVRLKSLIRESNISSIDELTRPNKLSD